MSLLSIFSYLKSSLKLLLTATILIVASYFFGRKVGWRKAIRWVAIKSELKQAKENLKNVEERKKMERQINRLNDDQLDKRLLYPKDKQ